MEYRKMIEDAIKCGKGKEEAMWSGIKNIQEILDIVKDDYPDAYWRFVRSSYEDLYGEHYNEEFARYDVSQMHSGDARGELVNAEQAEQMMHGLPFGDGITEWDKYVALNAFMHDFHQKFNVEQIKIMTYMFFFADEDFCGDGKVWRYMNMARG